MRTARALVASDPRLFGRADQWRFDAGGLARPALSDDLRLFATTFTAGFLFVSILIA